MFEAKLASAAGLKKIVDAVKDLLTDATWDCTEEGLSLQAMDSSHVALVSLQLNARNFVHFRCDRSFTLGINLVNMAKIMKCAANDDSVILRAREDGDTITFVFESESKERQSEYEIKLMDLEGDHLGIPDMSLMLSPLMISDARLNSRSLATVPVLTTDKFYNPDRIFSGSRSGPGSPNPDRDRDPDRTLVRGGALIPKEVSEIILQAMSDHTFPRETEYACIMRIPSAEFARICRDLSQMGDSLQVTCTKNGATFSAKGDLGSGTIRLSQTGNINNEDEAVVIDLREPCTTTFSLKYLIMFTKAVPLAAQVQLSLSNDVPISVEFKIKGMGYIRYYLAPKVDDNNARRTEDA